MSEENSTEREQRSTELIADFKDGFASGWAMLVPEAFRDALDIKMTSRVSGGQKELAWTQGSRFNFRETDLVYSATPEVYTAERWAEGVKSVNFAVSVLTGSPAGGGTNGGKRNPGFVRIEVLFPAGTQLLRAEIIDTTQDEFVRFLKMGFMAHGLPRIHENLHEYLVEERRRRENHH